MGDNSMQLLDYLMDSWLMKLDYGCGSNGEVKIG